MSHPHSYFGTNTLLNALSTDDLALLSPHFSRHEMRLNDVLVRADTPIEHVYFLESGVASIVAAVASSRPTEVGIFGRDGVSATCLLLGGNCSPHETFIQIGGGGRHCVWTQKPILRQSELA